MWIFFSILAAFCWSVANIIDKCILTKWIKRPLVPIIISGISALIAGIAVYFICGFSSFAYFYIFLAILNGVIEIFGYIFYFKALKLEEASRIAPLFYLSPLFILIFAAIFLNEIFAPLKYLGILLLVIGAVLISMKGFLRISFGRAFYFMILSVCFGSISALLVKYLLNFADFWTVFGYKSIGMAIGSAPIAYFYFPELIKTAKQYGKKTLIAMSASEILSLSAILFVIIAASFGYVTLVNALSSTQPFFVFGIALILSVFFPKILKEEINKALIIQKIIATVLMFIGAVLIT